MFFIIFKNIFILIHSFLFRLFVIISLISLISFILLFLRAYDNEEARLCVHSSRLPDAAFLFEESGRGVTTH